MPFVILLSYIPYIAIFICGLILFVAFHKQGSPGSILGVISFALFFITRCIDFVQAYRIHKYIQNNLNLGDMLTVHQNIGIATSIAALAAWLLLLISLYFMFNEYKNKNRTGMV